MPPLSVSVRKLLIFTLNLASTFFMLFTGLRENPLVVFVTGRYDLLRSRLADGSINYDIVRPEMFNRSQLPDLKHIGADYRFFSSPKRGIENLGSSQSLCIYVNALHAPFAGPRAVIMYDDFWGTGARRTQLIMHSVSAPNCKVLNVNTAWVNSSCIPSNNNSESLCHEYILRDFDNLTTFRPILRAYTASGTPGQAFLKCLGRKLAQFPYITDLLLFQSYWAGGSEHIEIQTSNCLALPLTRTSDWEWTLFRAQNADTEVTVVSGSDNCGWFPSLVSILYGVVSIMMITHGVFAAIAQSNVVFYMPNAIRSRGIRRLLRYCFPFMLVATWAPEEGNQVIHFKSSVLMASDVWMNHWLYILLSILDALVNLRMTYVLFQMATWMLSQKVTFSTFLFLCSTLTRLTWFMCFLHTALRWCIKVALRGIKSLKLLPPELRGRLEWYVDATALFMSYKIYSMLLFVIFYCFLQFHKTTTLMKREAIPKIPVEGGAPNIGIFWRSEIICDLVVFTPIALLSGFFLSTLLLQTKYRFAANNSVLQLMQQRYVFVGWDVFVAMEALGIDPFDSGSIVNAQHVALANCSLGSLIGQLYTSGPSGLVHLAGDHVFEKGGFTRDPVLLHYSQSQAIEMGLGKRPDVASHRHLGTVIFPMPNSPSKEFAISVPYSPSQQDLHADDPSKSSFVETPEEGNRKSVFKRTLRLCSEGMLGRILLADVDELVSGSMTEFIARDALSFSMIWEIKLLTENEKKLRIR